MIPARRFACAAILLFPSVCLADTVLDWNEVALARVVAARQGPPDGARSMAMVHLAMFEAINAVEQRYAPYAFKTRAPAGTSPEAAAAAAASSVLVKLFPGEAQAVEAAYAASLARIPEGPGKAAGIALGREAGAQCLSMRDQDGTGGARRPPAPATPGRSVIPPPPPPPPPPHSKPSL